MSLLLETWGVGEAGRNKLRLATCVRTATGYLPTMLTHGSVGTAARASVGGPRVLPRIPAHLIIHGGHLGMQTVIEGLVRHNASMIRAGIVPALTGASTVGALGQLRYADGPRRVAEDKPVWRDAVCALQDKVTHAGTLAAWQAASLRAVSGADATVGVIGGIPRVFVPAGSGVSGATTGTLAPDLSLAYGRSPLDPVWMSGLVRGTDDEVWDDWMVLSLLDADASAIGEVNTAIARHNARLIVERNLPGLYESGVTYVNEGVPERWLDVQQILIEGGDDCEGLAGYRAGELIAQGKDARVFCRDVSNSGVDDPAKTGKRAGRTFHALCGVYDAAGRLIAVDDPSPRAPAGSMPVPPSYLAYARRRRERGLPL